MTEERHAYWSGYLRDLADRMHLRDWDIRLTRDEPDKKEAAAMVVTIDGRKVANVSLCCDWDTQAGEQSRHYLVHELIHCHMMPTWDLVRLAIRDELGSTAYGILIEAYKHAEEYAVDALAEVIAPSMPLPPKEGADDGRQTVKADTGRPKAQGQQRATAEAQEVA